MMMIPEAYADRDDLPDHLKGFYAFHSCLMEPWDGPASVCFTDGTRRRRDAGPQRPAPRPLGRDQATATSCSAPRPACCRSSRTRSSRLGRLAPGKLFLVDLEAGRIVDDARGQGAGRHAAALRPLVRGERRPLRRPPAQGAASTLAQPLRDLPARLRLLAGGPARPARADGASRRGADRLDGQRQRARRAVRPAPAAVLLLQAALRAGDQPADRPDPRVDRHVAGHRRRRRGQPARGDARARAPARRWSQPILRNGELETLRSLEHPCFKAHTIDITWPVAGRARGPARAAWPRSATRPTTRSPPASTS